MKLEGINYPDFLYQMYFVTMKVSSGEVKYVQAIPVSH